MYRKLANVTPIFKKGDKQLIGNYRPISLLPLCDKIFEKIIFNNLYEHLTTHHLITKNQSGLRPGDSTTNHQVLDLVDEIHQACDSKKPLEARSVFLDISKAFDKMWRDGLIFKMRQNGISGSLLKLQNYLSSRKQRVVLDGFSCDYSTIDSGVLNAQSLVPYYFLSTLMILIKILDRM